MAVGSGVGSFIGYSKESSYGVRVLPATSTLVNSFHLNRVANRVQGEGIMPGALMQLDSHYEESSEAATATMALEIVTKGLGKLLENLMGTTVTPVQQGATTAYKQTHVLADNYGKKLSIQGGMPRVGGSVTPVEVYGAKATSLELSCSSDALLTSTWNFDAREWDDSQSAITPSYPSGLKAFGFRHMGVKMGTFNSEAAIDGVRGITTQITRPMATDRFHANSSGLKDEPITNGPVDIGGTITAEWRTLADFHDRLVDNEPTSLVEEWVHTSLAGTAIPFAFRLVVPNIRFAGDTQNMPGREVLTNGYPWVAKYDGTNMPYIEYMSTDTTV